jgi:hypothetical protein
MGSQAYRQPVGVGNSRTTILSRACGRAGDKHRNVRKGPGDLNESGRSTLDQSVTGYIRSSEGNPSISHDRNPNGAYHELALASSRGRLSQVLMRRDCSGY